ncbi:hypothetical protein TNCV_3946561 [Trichonephila clavipes]|nr:hypothetical protein TNCV_3946561 [Trichonephila clavipes]
MALGGSLPQINLGVQGVLISLSGKPVTTFHSVRTRRCTRATALNSDNQSNSAPFTVESTSLQMKVDWKYTRIYNPQRRLRILVERFRKDSSQTKLSGATAHEDQGLL